MGGYTFVASPLLTGSRLMAPGCLISGGLLKTKSGLDDLVGVIEENLKGNPNSLLETYGVVLGQSAQRPEANNVLSLWLMISSTARR